MLFSSISRGWQERKAVAWLITQIQGLIHFPWVPLSELLHSSPSTPQGGDWCHRLITYCSFQWSLRFFIICFLYLNRKEILGVQRGREQSKCMPEYLAIHTIAFELAQWSLSTQRWLSSVRSLMAARWPLKSCEKPHWSLWQDFTLLLN